MTVFARSNTYGLTLRLIVQVSRPALAPSAGLKRLGWIVDVGVCRRGGASSPHMAAPSPWQGSGADIWNELRLEFAIRTLSGRSAGDARSSPGLDSAGHRNPGRKSAYVPARTCGPLSVASGSWRSSAPGQPPWSLYGGSPGCSGLRVLRINLVSVMIRRAGSTLPFCLMLARCMAYPVCRSPGRTTAHKKKKKNTGRLWLPFGAANHAGHCWEEKLSIVCPCALF